jgi:hypothetical protein
MPGPHGFAVRFGAVRPPAGRSLTGKTRPAIPDAGPTQPRPPLPVPTLVTMANAPLLGTGWRGL